MLLRCPGIPSTSSSVRLCATGRISQRHTPAAYGRQSQGGDGNEQRWYSGENEGESLAAASAAPGQGFWMHISQWEGEDVGINVVLSPESLVQHPSCYFKLFCQMQGWPFPPVLTPISKITRSDSFIIIIIIYGRWLQDLASHDESLWTRAVTSLAVTCRNTVFLQGSLNCHS